MARSQTFSVYSYCTRTSYYLPFPPYTNTVRSIIIDFLKHCIELTAAAVVPTMHQMCTAVTPSPPMRMRHDDTCAHAS